MTVIQVADRYDSLQYDGTNEAEFAAEIPQYTLVSADSSAIQFQSGAGTWFCPTGGWVVWSPRFEAVQSQWNDTAAYEQAYVAVASSASIAELAEQVDELVTAVQDSMQSAGAATFNFAVGNTTVQVPILPAMPDASYSPAAVLFGGLALGNLTVTAVAPNDADTVDVTVNNSGLLALGASVLVTVTG